MNGCVDLMLNVLGGKQQTETQLSEPTRQIQISLISAGVNCNV